MELEEELKYFSEEKEMQLVSRVKELRSLVPSSKKELFCRKVRISHANLRTKTSLLENILLTSHEQAAFV